MSVRAVGIMMVGMALASAPAAAAGTFYVNAASASCSNSGPGTQATPYCTISAALAAQHASGTTIIVMPGIYREQVTVPASGVSGSPITLQAQGSPGNPVVVSGADDFGNTAQWTLYSGNVWLAASVTWSPGQVFADSARLASSTASPASLPARSFVWVSGSGLYVNAGGGNPGSHHAEVEHRNYGIYVSGRSWIVIDGFTCTQTEWNGIQLTGCSQITVTHDVATCSNHYGIQADNSSAVLIGSCASSSHVWSGIALTAGSNGCTVQDNESFGNITPNQANGIYDNGAPNNVIQRNNLHDNAYNGIFMSSGSTGNVMVQNRSWNNAHQGIEDIFCAGNTHVGDVSYHNGWNGFAIEGSATGTTVIDCIAVDNSTSSPSTYADLEVDASSTSGLVSNDNLFWNSAGGRVVSYAGSAYTSVSAYRSASGQDTRTVQADPRFVNRAAGDFHLMSGSPAIDNANSSVAHWPSTDADGNARRDDPATANYGLGPITYADRGAFEYQPAAPQNQPPTGSLMVTPSSGTAPLAVTADGSGSFDPEGGRIASYRFDFGDGTVVGPQSGPTAAHTYAAGDWTATLTVTDSLGASGTTTVAITVTPVAGNQPPTASLVVTPSSGNAPLAVTADGSGSSDPEGGRIASYRFDFGDGTVVGPQPGATAAHTYAAGNWTVTLTVTDSLGATGTAPRAVAVTGNRPPTASLVVTPSSGNAPLAVTANGSASVDPDGGRIFSYRFDFGDGTVVGPQPGATATHTYARGNFTATLTVTDSVGASGTATAMIRAKKPGPPGASLVETPSADSASAQASSNVIPATVDFAPRMTPNPVRTFAELAFDLQCPVPVWFRVFDIEGRLVRTVSSGTPMTAGRKVLVLDGLADGGAPLRSGVYLYDVRAGSQRAVGRFVVMR